jgi:hypothetical protein
MIKDKYIQKLEELVEHLKQAFNFQAYDKLLEYHTKWAKLVSELSSLKDQMEKEERPKYDYAKIRKAGMPCLKGISCNLCEVNDKVNFSKCLDKSEFASDDELEKLGLIDG